MFFKPSFYIFKGKMKKLPVKGLLIDLLSVGNQLSKVLKDHPKFNTLISYLDQYDFWEDDDIPYPSFKTIQKETGLKPYDLRKQIIELYKLMFPFADNQYISFKKLRYEIFLKFLDNYHCFVLDYLPISPKVGENITLPFFRNYLKIDTFYVEQIQHRLEGETQVIEIITQPGTFNSFWHYRKHQAYEMKEIGLLDSSWGDDYLLKKELLDIK